MRSHKPPSSVDTQAFGQPLAQKLRSQSRRRSQAHPDHSLWHGVWIVLCDHRHVQIFEISHCDKRSGQDDLRSDQVKNPYESSAHATPSRSPSQGPPSSLKDEDLSIKALFPEPLPLSELNRSELAKSELSQKKTKDRPSPPMTPPHYKEGLTKLVDWLEWQWHSHGFEHWILVAERQLSHEIKLKLSPELHQQLLSTIERHILGCSEAMLGPYLLSSYRHLRSA